MGRWLEWLYGLLMRLLSSLLLNPLLALQIALGCHPQEALQQRRGLAPQLPPTQHPRWLLHGASAGELAASAPLLSALARRQPDLKIIISTQNPAGLAMAQRLAQEHPMILAQSYLPWDCHQPLCRWLVGLGVARVLILETELWPGLYRACGSLGIPLALLNARLYPDDCRRYRWIAPLMSRTLQRLSVIAARDETDAAAFRALGALPERVQVLGELRHDLSLAPPMAGFPPHQLILLAASTHAPEERYLLEAFWQLQRQHPALRLIIAPRQVQRCPRLARQVRRRGLRVLCWSQRGDDDDWQVLLIDRLGVLPGLYPHATLVFIGGSFSAHGGHSPVEAALQGCALLIGPRVAHIAGAVAALQARTAIQQLPDPSALITCLATLLDNPIKIQQLKTHAQQWAMTDCGVADRYTTQLLASP